MHQKEKSLKGFFFFLPLFGSYHLMVNSIHVIKEGFFSWDLGRDYWVFACLVVESVLLGGLLAYFCPESWVACRTSIYIVGSYSQLPTHSFLSLLLETSAFVFP